MSQEQQFLSPEAQQTLFDKLQEAGFLSKDMGQAPSTPDNSAQQGVGNIDFATLQSMLKHASNPNAVPMQEGDKMHPMDAISQIGAQMSGPQKPSGIEKAGGPQIVSNAPANGLISRMFGMTTPGMSIQSPAQGLIPRLLGMKDNTPVNEPNYYEAAKQAGIDKFLPSGLARMPDGTPFVGPESFKTALIAQKTTAGQGNETYTTVGQLTSQGIPEDIARKALAENLAAGKQGVSSKEVGNYMGSERLKSQNVMAEARATLAGVAKLNQDFKAGGLDAFQAAAEAANKNLGNIERAQAAIDQIMAGGGIADQRQRTELAASIAQIAGNSQGVLTDERMNQFLPQSAKGKFGSVYEYWSNERQPVDFTGFLPQLQDLLSREQEKNKGISKAAVTLGTNIMSSMGQGNRAKAIINARNASPIVGNPPAKGTGAWRVIR